MSEFVYYHWLERWMMSCCKGVGIKDLDKAMEPFYTTKPEEERSGMGFTIVKTFMEKVRVKSVVGKGTIVYMTKTINSK